MRGLHHLELVRVFGEIPVKMTDTEGSNVTSYPKWKNEDIFKKSIIPDLTFAEQNLPFDAYADHRPAGLPPRRCWQGPICGLRRAARTT